MSRLFLSFLLTFLLAVPAWAGVLSGRVVDRSGAVLAGATVRITNVATGETATATTDAGGRFAFPDLAVGIYRVTAGFAGFSESSQTVVLQTADQLQTADFALDLGSIRSEVTVAADRGARDVQLVPLRADTINADQVYELAPVSTGDAMLAASRCARGCAASIRRACSCSSTASA